MIDQDRQRPAADDLQADPLLKLSSGRASWMQMTMVAAACALVIGLMIYGLNQPEPESGIVASSPGGTETTAAAPQDQATPQEQTGGNVAGGENVAPKPPAAQQDVPAKQPTPAQTKPAQPDDSTR